MLYKNVLKYACKEDYKAIAKLYFHLIITHHSFTYTSNQIYSRKGEYSCCLF